MASGEMRCAATPSERRVRVFGIRSHDSPCVRDRIGEIAIWSSARSVTSKQAEILSECLTRLSLKCAKSRRPVLEPCLLAEGYQRYLIWEAWRSEDRGSRIEDESWAMDSYAQLGSYVKTCCVWRIRIVYEIENVTLDDSTSLVRLSAHHLAKSVLRQPLG